MHTSLLIKERVAGRDRPLELLRVEAENVNAQVLSAGPGLAQPFRGVTLG